MKKRVITGVIGGILTILAIVFAFTPYIDVLVFIASIGAVYELMKSFGLKNKVMFTAGLVFAAATVVYFAYVPGLSVTVPIYVVAVAYIVLMLMIMVVDFDNTTFQQTGLSIISSFLLPAALSCFLMIKNFADVDGLISRGHAKYLIWICLSSSVLTDTFALFTGMKFGKHKLCPKVSPKKTVEGAIGGVVGSTAFNLIALFVCNQWLFKEKFTIGYAAVAVFSIIAAVLGEFGDLAASAIKRNFGIKDFGNILPGHGGIMDRMDSISFVAPAVYCSALVMLKYF